MFAPFRFVLALLVPLLTVTAFNGCGRDSRTVREIQSQRQRQVQTQSQRDHLGEAFVLLQTLVDLNPEKAQQQVAYHLNRWREGRAVEEQAGTPALLGTISDLIPEEILSERSQRESFAPGDVNHLRDCYLFGQILQWVDTERCDDPLLDDWLAEQEEVLGQEAADQLRTASRAFDWTVRNVSYESRTAATPPQTPTLPMGMAFEGAGYRQNDYQTVWRGTGDSLQRSGVFTQLCRQAGIPAFILSIQSSENGQLEPWCVGVLIGKEVYLFDPELAVFIPGPGQEGIATLTQARTDESILRRLKVIGFFEYPFAKKDVQHCVALLNLIPEAISNRMKVLESGLTGDRRMIVYTDPDDWETRIDAVPGIAGVRLWRIPLLAEVYKVAMEEVVREKPEFYWYAVRWSMMDDDVVASEDLSRGRWRHLHGQFDDDKVENTSGARTLYLSQRAPEFELAKLNIDVELQKSYGIRRELGMDRGTYERQIQYVRSMIQMRKRTATYWLSLIQYDDQRYENAKNWLDKRSLDESQRSFWEPAARYNLARTLERLGDTDRAIELYKSENTPQEHGNRIRARLLAKATAKSE